MTRGHPTYYDGKKVRYTDTNEPTPEYGGVERPCVKCGEMPAPEGYDACLGYIKGAAFACCGHGVETGYVAWAEGTESTLTWSHSIKIGKWTIEITWSRVAIEGQDYWKDE